MMQTPAPVIKCENLSKTFADGKLYVEVLKNINFEVMPSEMVAIMGASGSEVGWVESSKPNNLS